MNDMSTRGWPSEKAAIEIARCRAEYSERNPVSEGAVAMAELVHGDLLTEAALDALAIALGGWKSVERMISDDITPGDEFGQLIGGMTQGAVTAAMWHRVYSGDLVEPVAENETGFPLYAAASREAHAAEGEDFALAGVFGRLGGVPSGVLFRHMIDPVAPDRAVITGMGIAIALEEAALPSLRAACEAAEREMAAARGGAKA